MTRTTLGPVRSWRQRRTVRSETRSISAKSSSVRSWSSAGRVVIGIWSPLWSVVTFGGACDAGEGPRDVMTAQSGGIRGRFSRGKLGKPNNPSDLRERRAQYLRGKCAERGAAKEGPGLPGCAPTPRLGLRLGRGLVFSDPLLQLADALGKLGVLPLYLGDAIAARRPVKAGPAPHGALGLRPVAVPADALEHLLGAHAVDPGERSEGVVLGVRQDPRSVGAAAEAAMLQRDEVLRADPGAAGNVDLREAQLKAPLGEPLSEVVPAE